MCEKCVAIDDKIRRYRSIKVVIGDSHTAASIEKLIADLQSDKAALHPDQGK